MARSVFYYHLKRLKAKDKYASGKEMIKSIFYAHKGRTAVHENPLTFAQTPCK